MSDPTVLIVGSGPVGSAFARLIGESRPDVSITMLELGPQVTDPAGTNVRNLPTTQRDLARTRSQGPLGQPSGDSARSMHIEGTIISPGGTYLVAPGRQAGMPAAALSSCVGGMGVHWTCATPRPNDDERVPFLSDSELDAALSEAERLLAVTTLPENPYGRAIRDVVREHFAGALPDDRLPAGLPMSATPQPDGTIRWGGADTVLGDTELDLRPDTIARRLLVDGSRVTGVEIEYLPTGERSLITADVVVVAANALQTPQLLWASGIRPPALGRHLTEHVLVYSVVALGDEIVRRAGIDTPVAEIVKDPTASTIGVPYTQGSHPYRTQIMHLADPPFPVDEDAVDVGAARYVAMGNGVRKFPRPEDRVEFSDTELDGWGMPQMTIRYGLTDREHAEVEAAMTDLREVAQRLGAFVPGGEPRLMPAGTSLHYKGTVRMGDDGGESSVVDSRSRVWGFDNLFVGGNGVIPTATTTNPTLTSVALAAHAVPAVLQALETAALDTAHLAGAAPAARPTT
ncbi:GMC oxidoreductase [Luteimicrobium sp. DT211]|uniref:GMC oxidoreductase n=1 Tax=Luteimicrobium sp. DT211 TaxID=3393412 RepID=UPI003CEA94FE